MQTGTANKGAVHAMQTEQRGGVLRLDAASVLYGKRLSRFLPEHPTEAVQDDGVCSLNLLGRGILSG